MAAAEECCTLSKSGRGRGGEDGGEAGGGLERNARLAKKSLA